MIIRQTHLSDHTPGTLYYNSGVNWCVYVSLRPVKARFSVFVTSGGVKPVNSDGLLWMADGAGQSHRHEWVVSVAVTVAQ